MERDTNLLTIVKKLRRYGVLLINIIIKKNIMNKMEQMFS